MKQFQTISRRFGAAALTVLCFLLLPNAVFAQTNRGAANIKVKDERGQNKAVRLYEGSHALVIGVSDYENGGQDLPGVAADVIAVAAELERQGFAVTSIVNPNRVKLRAAIETFIENHGYEAGNRLLIYYAGHGDTGKTADGRDLGYIVPSDAPLRSKNENLFRRNAISMDEIEAYARRIEAKHALFVFDSCFSGSLLTARRSNVPPMITYKTTQPVRQFITAGTDEQEVPDKSIFRQEFVNGLGGDADDNRDGYITASELADFLQTKVTNYTKGSQTPQYGKIFDGRLDKGDFVFIVPKNPSQKSDKKTNAVTDTQRDAAKVEGEFWGIIKNSSDAEDFRAYKRIYPNGVYTALADLKIKQLTSAVDKSKNAPQEKSKPAATSQSNSLIVDESFFTFQLLKCSKSGTSVVCQLTITNNAESDRLLGFEWVTNGRIYDDAGNQGQMEGWQIANASWDKARLLPKVPVKAVLRLKVASAQAQSLKRIDLFLTSNFTEGGNYVTKDIRVSFGDVSFN